MISALAEAGAVLERPDYLDAARRCAEFVLGELRDADGRLLRSWKDGQAKLNAYLEDHAFLLEALVMLYEASFEPRWFAAARELADTTIERFADGENGGFFETSADHERLLARRKDLEDHPIPAGNSSAAYGLLRLAALSGEARYEEHAVSVLRLLHALAPQHPQAFAHLLQALDFHLARTREVALAGRDAEARAHGAQPLPAPHRARRRPRGRCAAAGRPRARGRPGGRLRVRELRLQAAGDRARAARRAAGVTLLAPRRRARPKALAAARRVANWGRARPRAAPDAPTAALRRAGLLVEVSASPARPWASRTVRRHPHTCLRIVMAPPTTPAGPGANDNASGVGVLVALAGRVVRRRARRLAAPRQRLGLARQASSAEPRASHHRPATPGGSPPRPGSA